MPLDVPKTITVETEIHVGCPKLRRPSSENDCPPIFRSLVHLTTSQGACCGSCSRSAVAEKGWLAKDEFREWVWKTNGDDARGLLNDEDDSLDWKRRSNGRWAGLGLDAEDSR